MKETRALHPTGIGNLGPVSMSAPKKVSRPDISTVNGELNPIEMGTISMTSNGEESSEGGKNNG